MAKKDSKKAPKPEKVKAKKGKKGAAPETASNPGMSAASMPGAMPSTPGAMPSTPGGMPSVPGDPNAAAMGMVPPTNIPPTNIPPEQPASTEQIEQTLKESSAEGKLKKLRSPINVRSCLLNILFLIILTLGIVLLWSYLAVDKFNFVTVVSDMSKQFGITDGFKWLWAQISGWFS